MELIRRVLAWKRAPAGSEPSEAADAWEATRQSRHAETVLAALDIDAAIQAHERWKERLMDYLEGRSQERIDPAVVRRDDRSALGRWLLSVGMATLGHQPAFALLMARHQYFHEQAADMVELAQSGEWDKAVQVLNGGYRYGSSQIVLLLKELKRGLGSLDTDGPQEQL